MNGVDVAGRDDPRPAAQDGLAGHDLGLARSCADEVIVMYAGQIVEQASTPQLFTHVRMPYTEALFEAIPRLERPATFRPQSGVTGAVELPTDFWERHEGSLRRRHEPVEARGTERRAGLVQLQSTQELAPEVAVFAGWFSRIAHTPVCSSWSPAPNTAG